MAEGQEQNRSEEATPFKLQKAREKGMVARGLDLGFAASLVALAAFLAMAGGAAGEALMLAMHRALGDGVAGAGDPGAATTLAARLWWPVLRPVMLFGGTVVATVLVVEIVQLRGLTVSAVPLKPDFTRLNPAAGLKRLFSRRMLMESAKSVVKLALYTGAAVVTIRGLVATAAPTTGDAALLARALRGAAMRLLLVFILLAAALAVIDQILSRRSFARQMRMSRREVTREVKDREGDARLKRRRQQVHAALVDQAKGVASVKDADLLLVNPEHVAVALGYRAGEDRAPRVLAKGAGHHALRLRRAAARWNVPVVRDVALARALFADCARRAEIGADHYEAVAAHYLRLEIVARA